MKSLLSLSLIMLISACDSSNNNSDFADQYRLPVGKWVSECTLESNAFKMDGLELIPVGLKRFKIESYEFSLTEVTINRSFYSDSLCSDQVEDVVDIYVPPAATGSYLFIEHFETNNALKSNKYDMEFNYSIDETGSDSAVNYQQTVGFYFDVERMYPVLFNGEGSQVDFTTYYRLRM